MATMDAYGARFIGNDVVSPRVRQQQSVGQRQRHPFVEAARQAPVGPRQVAHVHRSEVSTAQVRQSQTVAMPESVEYAEYFSAQMPTEAEGRQRKHRLQVLSRRTIVIASCAVVLLGATVLAIPHASGAYQAANKVGSKITLGIKNDIHPNAQPSFTMPQHSVLVKNDIATSYVDAVESQSIAINTGTSVVTPLPNDIANWIKMSSGPQKGTTLLTVNEAAVTSYVANAVSNSVKQPSSGSSYNASGVSSAANQITKSLLKYNGITVTVPGS